VRAGLLFGAGEERSLFERAPRARSIDADVLVSLTYLPDFANRCLDLAVDGASGFWHLAHEGARTMAEWRALGAELGGAPRAADPAMTSPPGRAVLQRGLRSTRWSPLPSVESALERYLRDSPMRPPAAAVASGF
jgi:dTDP-4-dehydrorhamnose reductase